MAARRRPLKGYLVFISYSHKDRWIARQFVSLIERGSGGRIRTFLDEKDIEGGQLIAKRIFEGIRQCDELVVLLSPDSKDRQWVLFEMGAAGVLEKPIMAILHNVSPKEMPDFLQPYKAIDLNDFDQYLHHLQKRAKEK